MIGFLLGLTLVLVNVSLKSFASPVLSSVALVTLLAWLTRGLHLDGLGDTFDGLGAGGDRERMLRVMDDSHTGAFGVIAIVLLLFFKIHAIEASTASAGARCSPRRFSAVGRWCCSPTVPKRQRRDWVRL